MWVPSKTFELFQISKDSVAALREELAAVRTERDLLKSQLGVSQNQFSWLSIRVNALEVERAQLLEKAYGIRTVVPEIVRAPQNPLDMNPDIFNDVGEEMAKKLGLPTFQ
jgi:hypothetical protein